jgi:spore coat protein U-like protein
VEACFWAKSGDLEQGVRLVDHAPGKRLGVGLGAVLIAALPASWATGQTQQTATMQVTATVNDNCTVSTSDLAFGAYSGAQLDSTATIIATCTNLTGYSIGLNAGVVGASTTSRQMSGPGTDRLNYGLYHEAGRTTNWDDIGGANPLSGQVGTGAAQNITVYGRIPAGQFVQAGSYSDTIQVTLQY